MKEYVEIQVKVFKAMLDENNMLTLVNKSGKTIAVIPDRPRRKQCVSS